MLVVFYTTICWWIFFVAIMQLEVSAAFMQVKVSATNMWVTIFTEVMDVGVSIGIMQVVFSVVQYAHGYFYCNYPGDCFCCSYVCDSFKQELYIPFSNQYPFFIKLTRKHQMAEAHCIKFAFHHFSKYSSKIKILCRQNLYKSWLKDYFSTFVFLIGQ